jgi:hypothetical protein
VSRVVAAVPAEDTTNRQQLGVSAARGSAGKKSGTPDRLLLIVHGGFNAQHIMGTLRAAMVKAGERPVELTTGGAKVLRGRKNVAALLADQRTVVLSHKNPHELVLGVQAGHVPREGVPALLRDVGLGPGVRKPAALIAMRTTPQLRQQMTSAQFPDGQNIDGLVVTAAGSRELAVALHLQCHTAQAAASLEARLLALLAQARQNVSGMATSNPLGKALLERLAVSSHGNVTQAQVSLSNDEIVTLAQLLKNAGKKG